MYYSSHWDGDITRTAINVFLRVRNLTQHQGAAIGATRRMFQASADTQLSMQLSSSSFAIAVFWVLNVAAGLNSIFLENISIERHSVLHKCRSDCMLLCLPSLQVVLKPSIISCT